MKLKNKKTGEIIDVYKSKVLLHFDGGKKTRQFKSLGELNEEWEDYEEPKEIWWLDNEGCVNHASDIDPDCFWKNKEIGNYFETKEEAEKAVEKLKAWKRLKDKGFKFKGWSVVEGISFELPDDFYDSNDLLIRDDRDDLDLLFGGEE